MEISGDKKMKKIIELSEENNAKLKKIAKKMRRSEKAQIEEMLERQINFMWKTIEKEEDDYDEIWKSLQNEKNAIL